MIINLFPTAAGLLALIVAIIADVLYRIFKKNHDDTKKWISLAVGVLSFVYLFVGCCYLFQDRYVRDGEIRLNNGITQDEVELYLDSTQNAADLIELLAPNFEITEKIEQKNSEFEIYYYYKAVSETASSEIQVEFCDTGVRDDTYLKFKNTWYSDRTYNYQYANDNLRDLLVNYTSDTPEEGENVAVIFTIKYDGIKFLAPWVEGNGSSVEIILFFDDVYVWLSESGEGIEDLTLLDFFTTAY